MPLTPGVATSRDTRGKRIVLSEDFPELASQVSTASPVTADSVLSKLKTPVLWDCGGCGGTFTMTLYDRSRGRGRDGCKKCSDKAKGARWRAGRVARVSLADAVPEIYQCLREENKTDPARVTRTSEEEFLLACDLGHEFTLTAGAVYAGNWCRECSYRERGLSASVRSKKPVQSYVAETPELSLWLSSELLESGARVGCNEAVDFLCRGCSSVYFSTIQKFRHGRRCPYCSSHRFREGVNDVRTRYPELSVSPDFELDVSKYTPNSLMAACKELGGILLQCASCSHDYRSSSLDTPRACPKCAPKSLMEDELGEFLGGFTVVERRDRRVIAPRELDFYFPRLRKAVEFNGDYWHSDKVVRASRGMPALEYHFSKVRDCSRAGVSLAFVWEHDWLGQRRAVEEELDEWLRGGRLGAHLTVGVSKLD